MKVFSCAQWPKGTADFSNNVTKDENPTWGHCKAICDRLCREGFGGDGQVYPLKVWVEDENGWELPNDPTVTPKIRHGFIDTLAGRRLT